MPNQPRIVPPTEKSLPSQRDKDLAREIQRRQRVNPIVDLRKRAEQYRTALLALTTLTSAAWIVGGVTKATDLTPTRRLIVGWFLAIAFLLLLIGSVVSMRAAYGPLRPQVVVVTNEQMAAEKSKEVKDTLRAIAASRLAIVMAVALLGLAIGIAFFNPKPLDAPLVKAVLRTATICGTLSGADSSHIRVETVNDSGEKVTQNISYPDLKGLRAVTQCP